MSLGYFGGRERIIIERKEERANPFEEYKKVLDGSPMNSDFLVMLLRWFSNHENNIVKLQAANKNFFFVDKEILARYVFLNIDRKVRFIKFPKSAKEKHDLDFLIPYICKYYCWSEREYEYYKDLISLEDTELYEVLNNSFGFSDEELKKVGLKREKSKEKYDGRKIRGFF